jgi:NlpC/P60 family
MVDFIQSVARRAAYVIIFAGGFFALGSPAAIAQTQGQAIVTAAEAMASHHYPYCFDGGTIHGPTAGKRDPDSDGSYSNCAATPGKVGFDCTGLTLYAVYQGTGDASLAHSPGQASSGGGEVLGSETELQPGDIVYFDYDSRHGLNSISHAGIYVGRSGNNYMVLSAVSERWGIRTEPISWYAAGGLHFVGAKRYWQSSAPVPTGPSSPAPVLFTPPSGPTASAIPSAPTGPTVETVGGPTNTWSDYNDAGGTAGPQIASGESVDVTCKMQGYRVADGDTWWYEIASSPWDDASYASADAFYNDGATSGSLQGTPFVDNNVPACAGSSAATGPPPAAPAPTYAETTGGVTHTWTDYPDAGGIEGPSIASDTTVQIECRVTGFTVADGNTWWYRIASGPWNGAYYASADAFYNDGATSGSLLGTPFVDPAVPNC